jgi:hypothetical protein
MSTWIEDNLNPFKNEIGAASHTSVIAKEDFAKVPVNKLQTG